MPRAKLLKESEEGCSACIKLRKKQTMPRDNSKGRPNKDRAASGQWTEASRDLCGRFSISQAEQSPETVGTGVPR